MIKTNIVILRISQSSFVLTNFTKFLSNGVFATVVKLSPLKFEQKSGILQLRL